MNKLKYLIATFFGVGNFPIAPGTAASFVTAGVLFFIYPYLNSDIPVIISAIIIFFIGIPAATYSEIHFNKKDPRNCVIDEVAGQLIALFFIPHKVEFYVIAFFAFRFFDILKPYPIKKLEKIGKGIGIMLDDVLAGIYALGLTKLTILLIEKL